MKFVKEVKRIFRNPYKQFHNFVSGNFFAIDYFKHKRKIYKQFV